MEGRGDGRCFGYRIPLDLGRGEPNLRFRRFCISLHSNEISFIIAAVPRHPNDVDNNDDDDEGNFEDDEANAEDDDRQVNIEDNDGENDIGDGGDGAENNEDSQNEDSDSDFVLDDNDEMDFFNDLNDQYAWIRFIWQVWPFSCGNIFDEIVFEFQGIREEDLSFQDYDIIQGNAEDNDNNANELNNEESDNADVEEVANQDQAEVGADQASAQADEHPLPLPLPLPTLANVRSKVEEIDEEAFRWWHEFDYNFSECTGIDADEDDPPPAKCEKKSRDNAQDVKREKNSAPEPDQDVGNSDLVEEGEASEEGELVLCVSETEAEVEPLPGPSRKRSRDEAGLDKDARSNKRSCQRSDSDVKTSDGGAEDTVSCGATKTS
ncbi:protein PFC0760c-like [Syngnathoides biaculeatus]|uniref:protein PFC0760c-like n=1 Tax=Syngnathoides biaculeatus TaxID=300417 RepID=UPI002ADE40E1|nr:protein PFC0760c-like [Syngnathoides biaculeatus]